MAKKMAVTLTSRSPYFDLSTRPITKEVEDKMELLSAGVTDGRELLLDEWRRGRYTCARCARTLYCHNSKWKGPCLWPSFRRSIRPDAISTREVFGYNKYTCRVFEVYCGNSDCDLFLGHMFEDGVEKGDTHASAHWRH